METSAYEFFNGLDLEEMSYFYHITASGNGEQIMEKGLLLKERLLSSSTIRITEDMLEDIDSFIKNEQGINVRNADEMVIIAADKMDTRYLVEHNDDSEYPYKVSNRYVVGYINMLNKEDNFEIELNPECETYSPDSLSL